METNTDTRPPMFTDVPVATYIENCYETQRGIESGHMKITIDDRPSREDFDTDREWWDACRGRYIDVSFAAALSDDGYFTAIVMGFQGANIPILRLTGTDHPKYGPIPGEMEVGAAAMIQGF